MEVLGPGATIEGLEHLPGGASRETWGFTARSPGCAPRRLVVRRDPPGALLSGVAREATVLEAVREGVAAKLAVDHPGYGDMGRAWR